MKKGILSTTTKNLDILVDSVCQHLLNTLPCCLVGVGSSRETDVTLVSSGFFYSELEDSSDGLWSVTSRGDEVSFLGVVYLVVPLIHQNGAALPSGYICTSFSLGNKTCYRNALTSPSLDVRIAGCLPLSTAAPCTLLMVRVPFDSTRVCAYSAWGNMCIVLF